MERDSAEPVWSEVLLGYGVKQDVDELVWSDMLLSYCAQRDVAEPAWSEVLLACVEHYDGQLVCSEVLLC